MTAIGDATSRVGVVVPCFNEADRLLPEHFVVLTEAGAEVLFIDDGSTDGTSNVLEVACHRYEGMAYCSLPTNQGKGEAVRFGMRQMIDDGVDIVCFVDADLATPTVELLRIVQLLRRSPAIRVAMGSRVRLMGLHVKRSMPRHYLSRVFATFASLTLREQVYDTQCGAKVFRVDHRLREALSAPFRTRWIFDIELLDRLLSSTRGGDDHGIREIPLEEWIERPDSKLTIGSMARSSIDLLRLESARRRDRT